MTWLVIAGCAILTSGAPLPIGSLSVRGDAPAAKRLAAAPTAQASCCSTAAKTSCCAAAVESSCCESEPPVPEAVPVSAETVVLRAMLACGGIVAEWLAVGTALLPPVVVACDRSSEPIASLILVNDVVLSERAAPAAPPPRSA